MIPLQPSIELNASSLIFIYGLKSTQFAAFKLRCYEFWGTAPYSVPY